MTVKPLHTQLQWLPGQQEVLDRVRNSYVHTDEETQGASVRFLHVDGKTGSGMTSVLLECAVRACKEANVLIVCHYEFSMLNIKFQLAHMEGVNGILVETLQGTLNQRSFDLDDKTAFTSLPVLHHCDLILMDEGAQYANDEWDCFLRFVQAGPHKPFLVIGTDFQQSRPVKKIDDDLIRIEGQRIKKFCKEIPSVALDSVLYGSCVCGKSMSVALYSRLNRNLSLLIKEISE